MIEDICIVRLDEFLLYEASSQADDSTNVPMKIDFIARPH
jgi:hypothetical protein